MSRVCTARSCLAGTGHPPQALSASVRQGAAQHAQHSMMTCCSTHLHLHSPAPHPALSACHTLALWMHCRRQRQRLPPHGRPRRRCRRCCRQSHRRLPGGQTTSQGDPAAGCPLQAPLLPPPCPHGVARRRTGCAPVGSLRWWPVLRGSAGRLPASRHGLRPSATRIARNRQLIQKYSCGCGERRPSSRALRPSAGQRPTKGAIRVSRPDGEQSALPLITTGRV